MITQMGAIESLVNSEYAKAAEEFGAVHANNHASYAVLKEEVEEAEEELIRVKEKLEMFWAGVRENTYDAMLLHSLEHSAKMLACEAIQVAAMAVKARHTGRK